MMKSIGLQISEIDFFLAIVLTLKITKKLVRESITDIT